MGMANGNGDGVSDGGDGVREPPTCSLCGASFTPVFDGSHGAMCATARVDEADGRSFLMSLYGSSLDTSVMEGPAVESVPADGLVCDHCLWSAMSAGSLSVTEDDSCRTSDEVRESWAGSLGRFPRDPTPPADQS